MNKLSKILLLVIVILVIALGIMTSSYFKVKKAAQENLSLYLEAEKEIMQLNEENFKLQNGNMEESENNKQFFRLKQSYFFDLHKIKPIKGLFFSQIMVKYVQYEKEKLCYYQ